MVDRLGTPTSPPAHHRERSTMSQRYDRDDPLMLELAEYYQIARVGLDDPSRHARKSYALRVFSERHPQENRSWIWKSMDGFGS